MSAILVSDGGFGWGRQKVVEGFNAEFEPGTISVLLGPNGCGKSTFLRALGKLSAPLSGEIVLDGKALHQYSARQFARRLASLSQSPASPEGMTVEELVAQGRYAHRRLWEGSTGADKVAVQEALLAANCQDFAAQQVRTLSGGQRRKAWIALCLAQGVDVLLLDEPTAFLDTFQRSQILSLIDDLAAAGKTIVMVLHEPSEAMCVADRVLGMKGGRLIFDGDPAEMLSAANLQALYETAWSVATARGSGEQVFVPVDRRGGASQAVGSPAVADSGIESSAASRAIVCLNCVYGGYANRCVLENLSCEFQEGAVTAIIGPNASGKSTLLSTVCGLLAADKGDVLAAGTKIDPASPRATARALAILTQEAEAPAGLSVEDYILCGRYVRDDWFAEWSEAAQEGVELALRETDLVGLRHRQVSQLSGGQFQRVRLAAALAQDTSILLLDEPATGLDPAHQAEFLHLVRRLAREKGLTVILVLHELWQVAVCADRVVALREGRIVASGPAPSVLSEAFVSELYGIRARTFTFEDGSEMVLESRLAAVPQRFGALPRNEGVAMKIT